MYRIIIIIVCSFIINFVVVKSFLRLWNTLNIKYSSCLPTFIKLDV